MSKTFNVQVCYIWEFNVTVAEKLGRGLLLPKENVSMSIGYRDVSETVFLFHEV